MLLWDTFFDAGEAQLKKGKYSKAEQLLKSALGEANSFEDDDPRLLRTLLALISVYQENKRPKDAQPHLNRAEELIGPESQLEASSKAEVIEVQLKQLQFEEPDHHAETALRERMVQIWETAGPEEREQLLESLLVLAESLRKSADEETARSSLMRALSVAEELGGAESEVVDRVLALIIDSFITSEDYPQAEEFGLRRLSVQTALSGVDAPRLAPTLATQSMVLEKQRRMSEALPLIERASGLPGDDRTFYYLSFVEALLRAGTPAEALAKLITLEKVNVQGDLAGRYELLLLRAFQGVEDWDALREQAERIAADPDSTPPARLEALLTTCELFENKSESNVGPYMDEILDLDSAELDQFGPLLARIGNMARTIGRRELSEEFFDRAIQARTKDLDLQDPRSVKTLFELGTIQERRRLLPDAVSSWEKSLEYLRRHNGQVDTQAEERRMRINLVEKLADIYIRQRRWERAEQAWRSLVRSTPATTNEHVKGRLGLTMVYIGQEDYSKALDYLTDLDSSMFDEAQCGRFLSDTAFLLEIANLVELGRTDEAVKKRDFRFSRRGGQDECSLSELYASTLVARKSRNESRLAEDGGEILRKKPQGANEQLLVSGFYKLLAENNARYFPPEPKPLDMTALQAYEKAVHWAREANGELDLNVAELYEESAKAAVAESAWDSAEEYTRKSLELYETLKGARSALLLSSLQRLGELQLGKGELDEAVSSLDRALTLAEIHLKPQDVQIRELLRSLVEAYRRRGEFQQSKKHLEHLLGLYLEYSELGVEGKLDDLLRGIRLLLGDDGDHREKLSSYLDEATELALARGAVAELSLAFCLGQKARLVGPEDPDQAISLLRQQALTLEPREEAPEFTSDQLLLARLLLYRGQPKAAISILNKLHGEESLPLRKPQWERSAQILKARARYQLHQFDTVGQGLDELAILVQSDESKNQSMTAEFYALKLHLHYFRADLVGEDEAASVYAELDALLEQGDWSQSTARHEYRERRYWELARFSFETRKLAPSASIDRLQEQVRELRSKADLYPTPVGDALVYLAKLSETSGELEQAFRGLVEARAIYESNGDGESLARARAVAELGRLAEELGENEGAVEAYSEAIAGLEKHLGTFHEVLTPLYLGLGRLGRRMSRLSAAEKALSQAIEVIEETEEETAIGLRSDVLKELAYLYSDQKRSREARETWLKLRDIWEDTGQLLPTGWVKDFGTALVADDAFAEALQFFLDTLPLRLDQGDDKLLLELYAHWLEMTRDCKPVALARESAEVLLEVREVIHSLMGDDPPPEFEKLWSRVLVGFAELHLANLYDGSETVQVDLETALRLRETHYGQETTLVGDVLTLRAELAFNKGDLGTAESCLTRALNIVESNLGPDTWEVAEILLKLATVYFRKNRFSPTEAVLQRTLELCRTLLADNDQRWIKVCHLRGKLSLELGRPAEAFGSLDRALTLSKKHLQPPGRSLLVASGRACLLTDRSDRALDLFTKAEAHFPEDPEYWDDEIEEVKLALGELLLDRQQFEEANDRLAKVLEQQEERIGYGDPRLARVYRALGRTASGLGDLDTAEERLEVALALQEEDLFSPLDLFEPFYRLASLYREQGAEERASRLLEENLERARPTGHHEELARMSHLLAESCERRGDLESAEAAWREAIENLENALDVGSGDIHVRVYKSLLEPLDRLAQLLTSGRRYTAAEELTKRRLKFIQELGPSQVEVSRILFDLAELYRIQELYSEAEELHQRVLATRVSEYGAVHEEVAKSHRALGQICLSRNDVDGARQHLQKSLEQQSQVLGEDHPDLAETLFSLGDLGLHEEKFAVAEERYRGALRVLEGNYGEDDFRTAAAWTALARLYEKKQQWSKAKPLLGRAVESVEAVLGPSHLEVADLLEKTGRVYLVCGAVDQVAEPLERTFAIRVENLGEQHPATARVLKLQGDHNVMMGDLKTARRLYSRADSIIADFHGADSPVRFDYRFAFASTLRQLGEYEQCESHVQMLLEQVGNDDQDSQLKKADLSEELGYLFLAQGKIQKAEAAIKRSLDTRSHFLSPNTEEVSSAFEALARIHYADGRMVTASALADRALDALESDDNNEERRASAVISKARIETLLARVELQQEAPQVATGHANTGLNLLRDLLGDQHPEVAATLHLLGEIALSERKLEKAEGYFEDALSKWEAFYGGSHPRVCDAVSSLASLYQQQGRLTLAEQFHQRNLSSLEGRFGADSPKLVDTLLGLGKLCRSQGNVQDAEAQLKRAAEIQGTVSSSGAGMKMADVLHTLALVYQDQRNYIAAEALLKKARDTRSHFSEDDSPEIAESNLALARLYRTSGKPVEAEPLLRSVLDWRSERMGEDHPEVASLLREMAELYADQKEYLKAQSLVRKALGIYGEALGHRNLELVGPLRQLARLLEASGDTEEAEKQRRLAEELMGAG
jgi:lipopolysaccharide biosynthesis regulator YciM